MKNTKAKVYTKNANAQNLVPKRDKGLLINNKMINNKAKNNIAKHSRSGMLGQRPAGGL